MDWLRKRRVFSSAGGAESDPRDTFIARVVAGKSFCDVGGLWGTTSEKVSVAAAEGAASLAMIDIAREGSELWQAFDARLAAKGIGPENVEHISADVTSADLDSRFDVVNCSGVVYHTPSPVHTLDALRRFTAEHLILASTVVPTEIRNSAGSMTFARGQALFVPYLEERELSIVTTHLREGGVSAIGIDMPAERWSLDDYAPWWWLFTASTLAQMLAATGFEVLDEEPFWDGKAHIFLARCV